MYWYIYLIKDSLWFYKIWRTKNIDSRLYKYKTENSSKIELLHSYWAINYIDEEKRLHLLFSSKKLNEKREWFKLDDKDINYIKSLNTEKEKLPDWIKRVSFWKLKVSKIVKEWYIAYTDWFNNSDIRIIEAIWAIILNNYIIWTSFNWITIYPYRCLCILDKRFNIIEWISADQNFKNELKLMKDKFLLD